METTRVNTTFQKSLMDEIRELETKHGLSPASRRLFQQAALLRYLWLLRSAKNTEDLELSLMAARFEMMT